MPLTPKIYNKNRKAKPNEVYYALRCNKEDAEEGSITLLEIDPEDGAYWVVLSIGRDLLLTLVGAYGGALQTDELDYVKVAICDS